MQDEDTSLFNHSDAEKVHKKLHYTTSSPSIEFPTKNNCISTSHIHPKWMLGQLKVTAHYLCER
jgi:hypothetical protein